MAEYIEREAAIKMMRGSAIAKYPLSFSIGILAAADELQKMPAADVAPVVHGRWICDPDPGKVRLVCSVCGHGMPFVPEYLPGLPPYCNCGARMDKES